MTKIEVVEPFIFNELFDNVEPDIFNDDKQVTFFNNVEPDTFNEDKQVALLFNVVNPDIYNDDIKVVLYTPSVNKAPLKTAGNLVVLSVDVQSNLSVGFIESRSGQARRG